MSQNAEKSKESAKSSKGKLGAICAVAIVLALAGVLVFMFTRSDSPDDYEYRLTITDATITGLVNKDLESLKIPDNIDKVPVTIIGEGAFKDCTAVTSVELPDSVKTLMSMSFANCTSLKSVKLPNSVTTIGVGSF